jgi:hypothetical protein
VREHRQRRTERAIDQELARRVRDMVIAADHMRDRHADIIDDAGEVVGRQTIRAHQHEVVEHLAREADAAAHDVVPRDLLGDLGTREAQRGTRSRGATRGTLLGGERTTAPVVTRILAARELLGAPRLELLGRAEARICAPIASRRCAYSSYSARRSVWKYGPYAPPTPGPSSQVSPSQRIPFRIACTDASVERSASVSSMRSTNVPPMTRAKR